MNMIYVTGDEVYIVGDECYSHIFFKLSHFPESASVLSTVYQLNCCHVKNQMFSSVRLFSFQGTNNDDCI